MNLVRRIARRLIKPAEVIEGYEHPELIDVVFEKSRAYQPNGDSWPKIGAARTVLDFGGAFGAHYKVASREAPYVRWAIVETPAMVVRAREIETDKLRFCTDIAQAARWLGNVDLVHSSGALQYVTSPRDTLAALIDLSAPIMLWSRLALTNGAATCSVQESFLTDNGPGEIDGLKEKRVRYLKTTMQATEFVAAHAKSGYRIVRCGDDWFEFAR